MQIKLILYFLYSINIMSIYMNNGHSQILKTIALLDLLKKKGIYLFQNLTRIENDLTQKNKRFFSANDYNLVNFIKDVGNILSLYEVLLNQLKEDFELTGTKQMGQSIQKMFVHLLNLIFVFMNMCLKSNTTPNTSLHTQKINHRQQLQLIVEEKIAQYKSQQRQKYKVIQQVKYEIGQQQNQQKIRQNKKNKELLDLINNNIKNDKKQAMSIESSNLKTILADTYRILKKRESEVQNFIDQIQFDFQNEEKEIKTLNFETFTNIHRDQNNVTKALVRKLVKVLKGLKNNFIEKVNQSTQTQQNYQIKEQKLRLVKLNKDLTKQKNQLNQKNQELIEINRIKSFQIQNLKKSNQLLFQRLNNSQKNNSRMKNNINISKIAVYETDNKMSQISEVQPFKNLISSGRGDKKDVGQHEQHQIFRKNKRYGSMVKVNLIKKVKQTRKNSEFVGSKFKKLKIIQENLQNKRKQQDNYVERLSQAYQRDSNQKNQSEGKIKFELLISSFQPSQYKNKYKILEQNSKSQRKQSIKEESRNQQSRTKSNFIIQNVIDLKFKLLSPQYLRVRKYNYQKIEEIASKFSRSSKNWRNKKKQETLNTNKIVNFYSTDFEAFRISQQQDKMKYISKRIIKRC